MGWPQRSSDRRRRRIASFQYPITINFDGDLSRFFKDPWLQSGGNVTNDQIALGAEMWDAAAAVFTSGTYAWSALGANTIANVSNELEVTFVDNASGAEVAFSDAADLNSDLTIDKWYTLVRDHKINLGNTDTVIFDGVANLVVGREINSVTMESFVGVFLAKSATAASVFFGGFGGGQKVYVDNLSLKPVTLASMFNPLKSQFGLADGFFIDISINTAIKGIPVGAIWNYDGSTNFGMAYMDGTSLFVFKNVAGTWTQLAKVAQAVTQDQVLRIENPTGTNVLDILYNGVSKATPTISDAGIISNTGIALFSTEAANAISKVVIGVL